MTQEISRRNIDGVWVTSSQAEASGNGGSQPVSVIGPFTVDWDNPGVNDHSIDVAELTAGTTIIRGWAIVTEAWVNTEGSFYEFSLELTNAAGDDPQALLDYPSADGTLQPSLENLGQVPADFRSRVGVALADGWKLRAAIWINGPGTLTAGSVDFYALVNVAA